MALSRSDVVGARRTRLAGGVGDAEVPCVRSKGACPMTNPSHPRARRIAGAALLLAGLAVGSVAVLPSPTVAAAPAPSAPSVVGLRKGAYGDAVKAVQE